MPIIERTYCIYAILVFVTASICPSSGELTVSMRYWYLSQHLYAHHQENLLYLCDIGICHSIYMPMNRTTYCIYATLVFVTASICPSSGELNVSMRHWYLSQHLYAHEQDNLQYLCDIGICHIIYMPITRRT